MTPDTPVEDLPALFSHHDAGLYRVEDLGRHPLMPAKLPRERWALKSRWSLAAGNW